MVAGSALVVLLATCASCTDHDASVGPAAVKRASAPAQSLDPYQHSPSRFGAVSLHAGFSPDPRVVGGTAVGEIEATTLHHKCKGWISETPDYLLTADTAFFRLHVLGRSTSDVLLVLRKPSGAVLCNDNSNGTKDPVIRSDFAIGTSQVWVAVQEKGAEADYRLGFSEVKWKSSAVPLPGAD